MTDLLSLLTSQKFGCSSVPVASLEVQHHGGSAIRNPGEARHCLLGHVFVLGSLILPEGLSSKNMNEYWNIGIHKTGMLHACIVRSETKSRA